MYSNASFIWWIFVIFSCGMGTGSFPTWLRGGSQPQTPRRGLLFPIPISSFIFYDSYLRKELRAQALESIKALGSNSPSGLLL